MFKKNYMLFLGGVLIFFGFCLGILSVTFNYVKLNREAAVGEFEEQVKAGAKQLQFYSESLRSDLLRIEKYLSNSDMKVSRELYGYLDFVLGHHPNAIAEILILDVNGKGVAGTNPVSVKSSFHESKYFIKTQHRPNRVYFSEAIIAGDLSRLSEVGTNGFMDPLDLGFVLYSGVYSRGVFKGAVLFIVRAEPFFKRYSEALTKLTSGYGFILQEDGRILFHRDVELRGKFISDLPESSDLSNDLLKKNEGKISGYGLTGQHMNIISEVFLQNRKWILGVSTNTSKLAQKTLITLYTLSGILLLLGIIVFGLVFSLIRLGKAKERLSAGEKRLSLILKQVGAVLWTTDTDLRFTSSHGSGLAVLKLKPGQVTGQTLYQYFQTDDPMFLPIASHLCALDGESVNYEQTWGGITFQTHVEPLRDTEGNISGLIGVSLEITERKRMEMALKASEEKYRSLVETITDLVFIIDPDGRFTYLNPEFEKVTGFVVVDYIGRSFTEILVPEYIEPTVDRFKRGLSGEVIPIYEVEIKHKDGKTVPVELKVASLLDDDGHAMGRIGVARDISKRKQNEEALRESEERIKAILKASPVGIGLVINRTMDWANETMYRMVGYKSGSLLGKSARIFYPDDEEFHRVGRELYAGIEESGNAQVETKWVRKDGSVFDCILRLSALDPSDPAKGQIVALTDVSELKRAHEEMRKSEAEKKAILDGITTSIRFVNTNLEILWANKAAADSVSKSPQEMVTHKCYSFWGDGSKRHCESCPVVKTFKTKKTEHVIQHTSDKKMFDLKAEPVFDINGNLIGVIEIAHDITDKYRLEDQLQQAQRMESIGTLAGGIAHDFNNILFPIFGYLEMLLADIPQDDRFHGYLVEVFNGAKRARDLIKQILAFSRQSDHERKPIEIQRIIKEALKLLKSSLPSTIKIRRNIKSDCGLVMADPTQVHQVVMNLCTNAFHAMEGTGGKLSISLKEVWLETEDLKDPAMIPGEYVCLTVADNGPGMEQSIVNRIFDPYFTTKKEGKGTGLGLAVVHGIVKSHNGHIDVNSKPGEGALFHVYLPSIKTEEVSQKEETDIPVQKGNERILLIDDQDMIVQMEMQMLERLGYHVTTRTSSTDALEAFRANPQVFDLVITDLTMPNMTGDKLAGELIKIRPEIPIILCTGFSEMMSKEKAESIGIKGFLMKPVVMKDLSHVIRQALDK
ncbi:MAG: PAS domain S-box protein [Thermodesulfobacteriota bacterium]|nr:PAS domain S-box protein [Thermodesulfobacteriota bacterium]